MLTSSELNRIRKRAEHILAVSKKKTAENSLLYAVLMGDALDVIALLEEVDRLRSFIKKTRSSDFKLVTPDEIKVLFNHDDPIDK